MDSIDVYDKETREMLTEESQGTINALTASVKLPHIALESAKEIITHAEVAAKLENLNNGRRQKHLPPASRTDVGTDVRR
jgi:hypothetical protein